MMCDKKKSVKKIVLKIESTLYNEKLWQTKYANKKEIILTLNTSQLRHIRHHAHVGRKRKNKHATIIEQQWKFKMKNWKFEKLKKNYLKQMTNVADKYSFDEMIHLMTHLTMRRLKKKQFDKKFIRKIIHIDWIVVRILNDAKTQRVLALTSIQKIDLILFETNIDKISKFKRSVSTNDNDHAKISAKRRRYAFVSKSRFVQTENESDMKINSMTTKNSDAMNDEMTFELKMIDNELAIKCDCQNIDDELFVRLKWKHSNASSIKNEIDCLDVLRQMIQFYRNDDSLMHVCHRHLHVIVGRLSLQIKKLTTIDLRDWLKFC